MIQEFIPYQQALELKELGFDEPCFGWYSTKGVFYSDTNANHTIELNTMTNRGSFANAILAPLYQQVFRWFREKHNLDISINTVYSKYNEITSKKYSGVIDSAGKFTNVGFYDTYEEAELECLNKLIQIIKENKQ